jgi:hypothetical protein
MLSKLFKKNKKSDINYLILTPVPKHGYNINENGLVDVLVPRFKSKKMQGLIPKHRSPYIRANLDEFGSEVWLNINKNITVEQIGVNLIEKFGERINPVYDRLTLFLTQLYKNGFITFKEFNERK